LLDAILAYLAAGTLSWHILAASACASQVLLAAEAAFPGPIQAHEKLEIHLGIWVQAAFLGWKFLLCRVLM
jgi:hypothetical protein